MSFRQTSGFRSISRQRKLYNRFVAGKSAFPAAFPGRSTHNYGFAVDLVPIRGTVSDLARLARDCRMVHAGSADRVHFDLFGFGIWNQILREVGLL